MAHMSICNATMTTIESSSSPCTAKKRNATRSSKCLWTRKDLKLAEFHIRTYCKLNAHDSADSAQGSFVLTEFLTRHSTYWGFAST